MYENKNGNGNVFVFFTNASKCRNKRSNESKKYSNKFHNNIFAFFLMYNININFSWKLLSFHLFKNMNTKKANPAF